MSENPYPRAVEAVEDHLKIDRFLESQKAEVFGRLEDRYNEVKDEVEAPLLFIAESIPLVSGIIQVESGVANFRAAVRWAKACVPNADPGALLTTLTLIYILQRGAAYYEEKGNDEKRETWERMAETVLMQMQFV